MRRSTVPLWLALLGLATALVVATTALRPDRLPLHRTLGLPDLGALSRPGSESPPAPLPLLFSETFDGQRPDPARWQVTGEDGLRFLQGDLVLQGPQAVPAAPAWASPGLYSAQALPAVPGRTVVSVARPRVGTVRGPLFLLSPTPFPADPAVAGYGAGFDSLGGDAGNGGANLRLTAITPEGPVLYDPEVARPVDYLLATTLRPGGSYHFASGGALGAFPEATLIWVGSAGGAGAGVGAAPASDWGGWGGLHVGIDARRTAASASSVTVVDLPGAFATPFGLARGADTFERPDAESPTLTEVGALPWRETTGDVRLAAGGLVRAGADGARAVFDPQVSDGLFEATVRTPEGPFGSPSLYFRYQDEQNWWRFRCNAGSIDLLRAVAGVESVVYQTGSTGCAPGATHRIVVRAHGTSVNAWINGTGVTFSGGVSGGVPGADAGRATGVGIGFEAGEASPVFDQVVAWPRTVTLPAGAGPAPSVPRSGDRTVVDDAFAGPSPARLQNRRPETGGPWREYSGTWVAGRGRLVPTGPRSATEEGPPAEPAQAAMAAVATGLTDVAATTSVELTPAGQAGADGAWVGGPVIRYTDNRAFIWARLIHRPAGSELELWESLEGSSRFLGSTDVSGRVGAGGRHTLKLAALGPRVAAYVDEALVLEGETAVTEGTWAGLLVTDDSLPAAFTAFRATSAHS